MTCGSGRYLSFRRSFNRSLPHLVSLIDAELIEASSEVSLRDLLTKGVPPAPATRMLLAT
jgi:hypothetical protein